MTLAIIATALIALAIGIAIGKAFKDTALATDAALEREHRRSIEAVAAKAIGERDANAADLNRARTVIDHLVNENRVLTDEASRSLPAAPRRVSAEVVELPVKARGRKS